MSSNPSIITPWEIAINKYGSLLPTKDLEDKFVTDKQIQNAIQDVFQNNSLRHSLKKRRLLDDIFANFLKKNESNIKETEHNTIIDKLVNLQINDIVLKEDVDKEYKKLKTTFENNLNFMIDAFIEHNLTKFKNAYNQLKRSSTMHNFELYKTLRLNSLFCYIISHTKQRFQGIEYIGDKPPVPAETPTEYATRLQHELIPYMQFMIELNVVQINAESLGQTPLELELSKDEPSGLVVKYLVDNLATMPESITENKRSWVISVRNASIEDAFQMFFVNDDNVNKENGGGRKRRNKKQTRRSKKTKKRRTGRSKK